MKNKSSKRRGKGLGELHDGFVKGFVSTGLLAAMRGTRDRHAILRAALQGGTALATASLVAGALARRSLPEAAGALALGAGGLYLIGLSAAAAEDDAGT